MRDFGSPVKINGENISIGQLIIAFCDKLEPKKNIKKIKFKEE